MKEKIQLIVTVEINYQDKKGRNEAIKKAKECVLSSRILGLNGCNAKKAFLIN